MIVDMEFHMNKITLKKSETRNATGNSSNPLQGMVNQVFNNIADSADDLENSMAGNDFEKAMNETSQVKTVVTLNRENTHGMGIEFNAKFR